MNVVANSLADDPDALKGMLSGRRTVMTSSNKMFGSAGQAANPDLDPSGNVGVPAGRAPASPPCDRAAPARRDVAAAPSAPSCRRGPCGGPPAAARASRCRRRSAANSRRRPASTMPRSHRVLQRGLQGAGGSFKSSLRDCALHGARSPSRASIQSSGAGRSSCARSARSA